MDRLTPEQRRLATLMSEASERSYCATWYVETEFRLWHFAVDPVDDGDWGYFPIPQGLREELANLSKSIGGWICWRDTKTAVGDDDQPTFVQMSEWLAIYERGVPRPP